MQGVSIEETSTVGQLKSTLKKTLESDLGKGSKERGPAGVAKSLIGSAGVGKLRQNVIDPKFPGDATSKQPGG